MLHTYKQVDTEFQLILTQKTSYIKRPVSRRVETLRLGSRTKAINATQRPMPIAER